MSNAHLLDSRHRGIPSSAPRASGRSGWPECGRRGVFHVARIRLEIGIRSDHVENKRRGCGVRRFGEGVGFATVGQVVPPLPVRSTCGTASAVGR